MSDERRVYEGDVLPPVQQRRINTAASNRTATRERTWNNTSTLLGLSAVYREPDAEWDRIAEQLSSFDLPDDIDGVAQRERQALVPLREQGLVATTRETTKETTRETSTETPTETQRVQLTELGRLTLITSLERTLFSVRVLAKAPTAQPEQPVEEHEEARAQPKDPVEEHEEAKWHTQERIRIAAALAEDQRIATSADIAADLDSPIEDIELALAELEKDGCLERIDEGTDEKTMPRYRLKPSALISAQRLAQRWVEVLDNVSDSEDLAIRPVLYQGDAVGQRAPSAAPPRLEQGMPFSQFKTLYSLASKGGSAQLGQLSDSSGMVGSSQMSALQDRGFVSSTQVGTETVWKMSPSGLSHLQTMLPAVRKCFDSSGAGGLGLDPSFTGSLGKMSTGDAMVAGLLARSGGMSARALVDKANGLPGVSLDSSLETLNRNGWLGSGSKIGLRPVIGQSMNAFSSSELATIDKALRNISQMQLRTVTKPPPRQRLSLTPGSSNEEGKNKGIKSPSLLGSFGEVGVDDDDEEEKEKKKKKEKELEEKEKEKEKEAADKKSKEQDKDKGKDAGPGLPILGRF